MYLRRIFSSSRLVRLLSDLGSVDVEASRQDVAERLALWLDVFDAITLHDALQSINAVDTRKPADAALARSLTLEEEFHRVRTTLMKGIVASGLPAAGASSGKSPPGQDAVAETDAGYKPFKQRYLDQQRLMALRVDALRDHVRQTLAKVSPALSQLAAFDAAMDQRLGGREQKLLSSVPVMLERRFEQLRKTERPELDAEQPETPALPREEGGWQDVFSQEMQDVLLAELEVRLQPVVGLIEAFSNEVKKCQ